MANRAKARRLIAEAEQATREAAEQRADEEEGSWPPEPIIGIPQHLPAELPDGAEDTARSWCTSCGLADPPMRADKWSETPPCPRCGSRWRWWGRIADRDGTATGPPPDECLKCYEWRRFPEGQAHFGWGWWRICPHTCGCKHHETEVWLA
ncbi:hypothetical protein JOL79_11430 [Microbispora sp. RL4-1S]|uniref:Uncharacterized protein n=1 Tax=Microbispora oryzae TaxID=2806554 RepID=A0A941AHS8_9ACTN|nr:hypothetical protein [Microbispora oryzae]MBP2704425.1 hypothetical protein [Microbispora oryzae]